MKERNLKQIDGKWYLDFTFKGRRIRQFGGYTKAQARNTLAKLRIEKLDESRGLTRPGKDVLFDDFARKFIDRYSTKKREKTRISHQTALNNLLKSDLFKGRGLSELTAETISNYQADRGARNPVSANRRPG